MSRRGVSALRERRSWGESHEVATKKSLLVWIKEPYHQIQIQTGKLCFCVCTFFWLRLEAICSCVSTAISMVTGKGRASWLNVGVCSDLLKQNFHYWNGWEAVWPEHRACVCVRVCVVLPSDSPPCSWLRPAEAAAPPRRWSVVGPAPGPRQHEVTRMRLWWGGGVGLKRGLQWWCMSTSYIIHSVPLCFGKHIEKLKSKISQPGLGRDQSRAKSPANTGLQFIKWPKQETDNFPG